MFYQQESGIHEGMKNIPAQDVDEYLASVPERERAVARRFAQDHQGSCPGKEESISYRMPAYSYHGPLVFFAAIQNHLDFRSGE